MNIPFKCLGKMITEDEMKRKRRKEHTAEKWALGRFIYQSPAHRCFKNSRDAPSLREKFGVLKPVRVPIPKPFPMRSSDSYRCSRDVAGSCMWSLTTRPAPVSYPTVVDQKIQTQLLQPLQSKNSVVLGNADTMLLVGF
jgi:hypothetical protein